MWQGIVDNDANVAALGEWRFGSGRGVRNFIYVTISTSIGGGVVVDGRAARPQTSPSNVRHDLELLRDILALMCGSPHNPRIAASVLGSRVFEPGPAVRIILGTPCDQRIVMAVDLRQKRKLVRRE